MTSILSSFFSDIDFILVFFLETRQAKKNALRNETLRTTLEGTINEEKHTKRWKCSLSCQLLYGSAIIYQSHFSVESWSRTTVATFKSIQPFSLVPDHLFPLFCGHATEAKKEAVTSKIFLKNRIRCVFSFGVQTMAKN